MLLKWENSMKLWKAGADGWRNGWGEAGSTPQCLIPHCAQRAVQSILDQNSKGWIIIFFPVNLDFFCSSGQLQTDCVMTIFCVLFEYIIGMGSSSMCIRGAEQNVLQTLTEKSVSLPEINTLERHKKLLICVQSIRRGNWEVRQGRFCGLYYLLPLFSFKNNPPRCPVSFWENCWVSCREFIHPNPCELFNSFRAAQKNVTWV